MSDNKHKSLRAIKKRFFLMISLLFVLSAFFVHFQISKSYELDVKYKRYAQADTHSESGFLGIYEEYLYASALLIILFLIVTQFITRSILSPLERFLNDFKKGISHYDKVLKLPDTADTLEDVSTLVKKILDEYVTIFGLKEDLDLILANMTDALIVIRSDGEIVYLNNAACGIIGDKKESLKGGNISSFIEEENGGRFLLPDVSYSSLKSNSFSDSRFVCKTTTGKMIPVEVSTSLFKTQDNGINSIICLIRDVTSTRRTEDNIQIINQQLRDNQQQLKAANDELKLTLKISESLREDLSISTQRAEELAKVKSEFLANMSHEIRTPMTAIIGFSNLLKRTRLSHIQEGYLDSIISSGNLLISIINDILDVSKIEAGKIVLEKVDFNLQHLLNDVFRMILARMQDSEINTYIDIDPDVPIYLNGDPTRLKQILINLLGNATKFTHKGSIGVVVTNEPDEVAADTVSLRFVVRDTGIGMTEEEIMTIFDAFSQADTSTTREYGGTGLGLTICKSLIEIMKGHIWVKSEKNEGSEFIFVIPISKAKDERTLKAVEEVDALKGIKVMVVDDNDISAKINTKLCHALGMEVLSVEKSSIEALATLERLKQEDNLPEILLTDLLMDELDGYILARKVREKDFGQNIKIIAITVVPQVSNKKEQTINFDGYMIKPVTQYELSKTLIKLIKNIPDFDDQQKENLENFTNFKDIRVLVADDSTTNQLLIEAFLKEFGCKAEFAKNGKEAIAKLKESLDYDMVFMDLQMPVLDGIQATKIIRREISEDIPIIAITADIVKVQDELFKNYQMNDFIVKPFEVDQLKDILLKYKRNV